MHAHEHVATAGQVASLLAEQFPEWAGLPVTVVAEFGTDHCLFRIGDGLVARMPRVEGAVAAWCVLPTSSRSRFRDLVGCDDVT